MTTPSNPLEADLMRAQAIIDGLAAVSILIEEDNLMRAARGGPTQVMVSAKHNVEHMGTEIARAFDIAWTGPTAPTVPAEPTGGE